MDINRIQELVQSVEFLHKSLDYTQNQIQRDIVALRIIKKDIEELEHNIEYKKFLLKHIEEDEVQTPLIEAEPPKGKGPKDYMTSHEKAIVEASERRNIGEFQAIVPNRRRIALCFQTPDETGLTVSHAHANYKKFFGTDNSVFNFHSFIKEAVHKGILTKVTDKRSHNLYEVKKFLVKWAVENNIIKEEQCVQKQM